MWYTGNRAAYIGRLDPATGKIAEYPTGSARDPHTLVWQRGRIWFTVQQGNAYGVLDPATGRVRLWDAPVPHALPYGIQPAPDGTLWIALFGTHTLGHVDPATGAMTQVALPDAGTRPRRLTVDRAGRVWYSDYPRSYLGRYDPKSGATKEWKTQNYPRCFPYGVAVAPDGKVWFDEAGTNDMVVFDPATGQMATVPIPTRQAIVRNVDIDARRGRLWLALSGTQRLGRIDLR